MCMCVLQWLNITFVDSAQNYNCMCQIAQSMCTFLNSKISKKKPKEFNSYSMFICILNKTAQVMKLKKCSYYTYMYENMVAICTLEILVPDTCSYFLRPSWGERWLPYFFQIVKIAKKLKKEKVNVDVINFGEEVSGIQTVVVAIQKSLASADHYWKLVNINHVGICLK